MFELLLNTAQNQTQEVIQDLNTVQNTELTSIWSILEPGLCHYLILGLIIFIIGLIIVILGKNLIKILIGFEFMLNSVCINFVAANTFLTNENSPLRLMNSATEPVQNTIANSFAPVQNLNFTFSAPEGQAAALIITTIGAINAAAVLGLICAVFFKFKNIKTSSLNSLKSADCPSDRDLENESGL